MKHTLLTITLLLAAAPAALAWPFTELREGGSQGANRVPIAFHEDTDPYMELFLGGPYIYRMNMAAIPSFSRDLAPTTVTLPLPDNDPFAANDPAVKFIHGRGDVGDIDGDGDMDIVYSGVLEHNGATSPYNLRVVACRNNGNGTWTRTWQMKTTLGPRAFAPEVKLADFDSDGDLDCAETTDKVRIHWNDGTGNFPTALTGLAPGFDVSYDLHLEAADFDGNGWIDLVACGALPSTITGRIVLLSNDGGTFTASTVFTAPGPGTDYQGSAVADLNGDGRPDLLTTRHFSASDNGGELNWLANTASGFAAPQVLLNGSTDSAIPGFQPADVDQDGVLDIVFAQYSGEAGWLRGTGSGSFAAQTPIRSIQPGFRSGLGSIGAADMDGDGDMDLVPGPGLVLRNEAYHMQPLASVVAFSGINPSGTVDLTVGDVNNDGKDDLIAADGGGQRIRWYAGNGAGLAASIPISTGGRTPLSVAAGDFNKDGWTDLAWSTPNSPIATLTLALSSNGSGIGWTFTTPAAMFGMTDIQAADMDRDGDEDILAISPSGGFIEWHVNNRTALNWTTAQVDTGLTGLSAAVCGQYVAGGRPEVISLLYATSGAETGTVESHRHNGAAWVQTSLGSVTGSVGSRAVALGDVDPAASAPGQEAIFSLHSREIFSKNAGSSLRGTITGFVQAQVKQLAAADWNQDGYTDVLAATANGVVVYPHSDTGRAFYVVGSYTLAPGLNVQDLVVMDLNGDPFPDAVAVDSTGTLHLITNRTAQVLVNVTPTPQRVLSPGSTKQLMDATVTNQDCEIHAPAYCAPTSLDVRFLRSNVSGGVDSPGTLLTQAEVSALVQYLTIWNPDSESTNAVLVPSGAATASYSFPIIPTVAHSTLAVVSRATKNYQIQLRLKSTAATSAVQRFYVEYMPSSQWATQVQNGDLNPTPARVAGHTDVKRTLVVVGTPTLLEEWRTANFGQPDPIGLAANDADPDGDRIPNLLEYVSAQNPNSATGIGAGPVVGLSRAAATGDMVADLRLLTTYDSRVRLTLQYSLNPAVSWSQLSTRTGTGAWSFAPIRTVPLSGGSRTRFEFDGGNPAIFPKAFYRLKAEELP